MSHFARADELDCTSSDEQVAVFDAARHGLAAEVSLRNSPSVMGWPSVPSDWVRPGMMLYGATPFERRPGGGRTFAAGDDPGVESHLRARTAGR
jgi:alanine racemase